MATIEQSTTEGKLKVPALSLYEHADYSYVPRTKENAQGADVTVAFAVDYSTAGERLTAREAGKRYIKIPFGTDALQAADQLAAFLIEREGDSLNVAGNGIYTFAEHGINQARVNRWVFEVLAQVSAKVKLSYIRSGGQTGADQAGLVASLALGIPAVGLYPHGYRRRLANGQDVRSNPVALEAELRAEVAGLMEVPPGTRKFHPDGTLPQAGEVFVFGSNLAGRHGAGSALVAKGQFGAIQFQGKGRMGQSYGIPTKDGRNRADLKDPAQTRSLQDIKADVDEFIAYARANPSTKFFVTRLGCVLATHTNADIAPLFRQAPDNCSFPEPWKPWLGDVAPVAAGPQPQDDNTPPEPTGDGINIWSGAKGLGGALTNMSELAKKKGGIKHSYPVRVNGVQYPDSEAAYQALKRPGDAAYNDGLMIDIICLKFQQNLKLKNLVTERGGVSWLGRCSHFTGAKSERFQAWEGQGVSSRFIRNLIHGYQKSLSGEAPETRVVHVKEAPFDVYIGRKNGDLPESEWANPYVIGKDGTREEVVTKYYKRVQNDPVLMAKVHTLRFKTLGCWCNSHKEPDQLCHGHVLTALAEGREWKAPDAIQGSLF